MSAYDPKRTFTDMLEKQTGGPFGPPAFFDSSAIALRGF